jgi:hypothetical protein
MSTGFRRYDPTGRLGTTSLAAPSAWSVCLLLLAIWGVGSRPRVFHPGPRCQNALDGAAVKGAASAVREAQAEGPTLTGATPARLSLRVREGANRTARSGR